MDVPRFTRVWFVLPVEVRMHLVIDFINEPRRSQCSGENVRLVHDEKRLKRIDF